MSGKAINTSQFTGGSDWPWLFDIADVIADHVTCKFFDLRWAEGKEASEESELDPLVKSTGVASLTTALEIIYIGEDVVQNMLQNIFVFMQF